MLFSTFLARYQHNSKNHIAFASRFCSSVIDKNNCFSLFTGFSPLLLAIKVFLRATFDTWIIQKISDRKIQMNILTTIRTNIDAFPVI